MCAGDVCATGVAFRDLCDGTNNVGGVYGRARPYAAIGARCEIVNIDLLVGRASHDSGVVQGKHTPHGTLMAFQAQLWLPLADFPHDSRLVPAPRDDISAFGGDVERADIHGMAKEQKLGVIVWGGQGLLDFDDCVLAAGDDQAVRVLAGWGKICDAVDELGALGDDGAFEGGRSRGALPGTEGVVTGDGDDRVRFWEDDIADLEAEAGISF